MLSSTPPQSRSSAHLDRVFGALSHSARRSMLSRLAHGPLGVCELAAPMAMSLPAVSKHLKILERAGLVRRNIDGRVHRCSLRPEAVAAAEQWLAGRRAFWEEKLDSLAKHIAKDSRGRDE